VQRRFQKVVEVAPCLTLPEFVKQKMYDYAIRLGKESGYSCAGTAEFLVDKDYNIFFIEVNPRIQVEHTITEEVTGIDIVRSQLLICMGYRLSDKELRIANQENILLSGCAIQCRVTTEDPSNDFKPDYGTLTAYRSASGFGIRLDAGSAYPGSVISPFFDSLLVKVTAGGRTLKGAAQRLHRALREFRVRGVKTNIDFLLNLLRDPDFLSGEYTVEYFKEHPELFDLPVRKDRGTKVLKYQRQKLLSLGAEAFAKTIKKSKAIHYTDTTFRDAHQSLLATRMRMGPPSMYVCASCEKIPGKGCA